MHRIRLITQILLASLLVGCQVYRPFAAGPDNQVGPSITSVPPKDTVGQELISSSTPTGVPAERRLTPTPPAPVITPPQSTPTILATTEVPVTTLLFTGVIVPARCVQAAIDANGNPDYPYEEVSQLVSQADLAVGTLNATISDYPPHTGCVPTYVLVGSANNADALARAGFDAMSVATNHIKNCGLSNCGNRAFFDTLVNLDRVGIATVGAGKNHADAMQPIVLTINGVRFGIVSLGQIEPMAFAGPDEPGIAILNETNLKEALAEARKVADVVIAMPHWGPEDTAKPNWIQRGLARQLVDAGADLVVGNHTHVVQAIQEIDGVQVFYGLGNFVFDQDLNDHQQGVILQVKFVGSQFVGYDLIPVHTDQDGRVHLADQAEADEILTRIQEASQAVKENR